MNTPRNGFLILSASLLLSLSSSGCDRDFADPQATPRTADAAELVSVQLSGAKEVTPDEEDPATVLAELSLADGARVMFFDAGDHVAMMEILGAEAPSQVEPLLDSGMSTEEIYLSLAPAGATLPAELDRLRAPIPTQHALPCAGNDCDFVGYSSTCYGFSGPAWIDWIEDIYPGFDDYQHTTNSTSNSSWHSPSNKGDYRATLCPLQEHSNPPMTDGGIVMEVKRRKTSPTVTGWTYMGSSGPVGREQRAVFWDLGAAQQYQWQTEISSVDVGIICHPQIPWLCSPPNSADKYHFSQLWD